MTVAVVDTLRGLDGSTVLVVPCFDGEDPSRFVDEGRLPESLRDLLSEDMVGSRRYSVSGIFQSESRPGILLIQAGKRERYDNVILSNVAASASRFLTARGMGNIAYLDAGELAPFDFAYAAALGLQRGAYNHMKWRNTPERRVAVESVSLLTNRRDDGMQGAANLGQSVAESAALTRDLVNMPPNELTPEALVAQARSLAEEHGWQLDVLDEGRMADLGMGAFLAVASGSDKPSYLMEMRLGDPKAEIRLALVGKGLTFDSGGLSLKTAEGMETMKGDMGGAAAVLGGLRAVSQLGLEGISVTGYIGATENMPSGHSMRPGDIVRASTGDTIEILNTDAEGRLVLADVLAYAESRGATHIVDFATLTGGAVTALGHASSLVVGRPFQWGAEVTAAGNAGAERAWQMPLYPEYRIAIESEFADIKNSAGRAASPMTAAAFLAVFVKGAHWAHIDIAGTAFQDTNKPYEPVGGTGVGVATIVNVLRQLSNKRAPSPGPREEN